MHISIFRVCFERRKKDADIDLNERVFEASPHRLDGCFFWKNAKAVYGNEVHRQESAVYIDVVPRGVRLRDLRKA